MLVADGIEYAGNLGTLVRTADAAGADGLVLTNAACRLTHPKVFEASRGTVLSLPVLSYDTVGEAAATWLPPASRRTSPTRAPRRLPRRRLRAPECGLVVGSEGDGVAPEWRTRDLTRFSIPMRGRADSLNVAASASVLLFDAGPPSG